MVRLYRDEFSARHTRYRIGFAVIAVFQRALWLKSYYIFYVRGLPETAFQSPQSPQIVLRTPSSGDSGESQCVFSGYLLLLLSRGESSEKALSLSPESPTGGGGQTKFGYGDVRRPLRLTQGFPDGGGLAVVVQGDSF
jgi:hypothetical protein